MSIYFPPEWGPQSAVILTWPHSDTDWKPWLHLVEPVYIEISKAIAKRQSLVLLCRDAAHQEHINELITQAGIDSKNVRFVQVLFNDCWTRDFGPISLYQGKTPTLLNFEFNGWGGKFDAALDNQVNTFLHLQGLFGRTPIQNIDLVLEGGSIETDGQGTLLTTTNCLLTDTRNPQYRRPILEQKLKESLGATRILWLEHGALEGDDTDSHIDMLARFCSEKSIAYTACDDRNYIYYDNLKIMERELRSFRDHDGDPYQLIPLPWPQQKQAENGDPLPTSYANFLIINGAVLVPTYQDPKDQEALDILAAAFPNHEIVGIDCSPLVLQYGSLHCISMQLHKDISFSA